MKRSKRHGRTLRRRYGRALPLIALAWGAKLKAAEQAEKLLEPLVRGAKYAWVKVAGRKRKKRVR